MNLTAPTKLQRVVTTPLSPRKAGAWAIQASHQFLAEKVREARSPKLPSPPIRFIGFIQAAKASFPRFGSKINDIIGVSADILKTIDWISIIRGCRVRHGTDIRGISVYGAKLRDQDVTAIRMRLQQGENQHRIADDYGISNSTVSLINRGKIWCHVA